LIGGNLKRYGAKIKMKKYVRRGDTNKQNLSIVSMVIGILGGYASLQQLSMHWITKFGLG